MTFDYSIFDGLFCYPLQLFSIRNVCKHVCVNANVRKRVDAGEHVRKWKWATAAYTRTLWSRDLHVLKNTHSISWMDKGSDSFQGMRHTYSIRICSLGPQYALLRWMGKIVCAGETVGPLILSHTDPCIQVSEQTKEPTWVLYYIKRKYQIIFYSLFKYVVYKDLYFYPFGGGVKAVEPNRLNDATDL